MTNSNQENCVSSDREVSCKWNWLQSRLGDIGESGYHQWLESELADLEARQADWITEKSRQRSECQELLQGRG